MWEALDRRSDSLAKRNDLVGVCNIRSLDRSLVRRRRGTVVGIGMSLMVASDAFVLLMVLTGWSSIWTLEARVLGWPLNISHP